MTGKNVIAAIILAIILSISGFLGYIYYADVAAMSSIELTINDVDITDVNFTSCQIALRVPLISTHFVRSNGWHVRLPFGRLNPQHSGSLGGKIIKT